ncbi:hypothetical protein ES703_46347 [subsurface metagenome]
MAITEATIRMAHLYPELIPDTWAGVIAAASEAVPPILDLRRFSPLFLRLSDIAVARSDTEELRIFADKTRAAIVAGSLIGNPAAALGGIAPSNFNILATEKLYYNLYSTPGGPVFSSYYGVWAWQPTVADKLLAGNSLTPQERLLDEELGISKTVEKGLLPLPIALQIEREYQILEEMTYGHIFTVTALPGLTVSTLHPRSGEFLVLTKIACDPSVTVFLTIDRDDDAGYRTTLNTLPLSLDFDLKCFIPALKEIRMNLFSIAPPEANFNIRYTVLRCKMNNIMRARWNLVSPDELPGDVYKKVKGGIL